MIPIPVCAFFMLLTATRTGHFTYECKASRPYVSRPSRTAQLENPRVLTKLKADGKPSVDVPEEFKNKCVLFSPFYLSFLSRGRGTLILRRPKERNCGSDLGGEGKTERGGDGRRRRRIEPRNVRSGMSFVVFYPFLPSARFSLSAAFTGFLINASVYMRVLVRSSSASVSSQSESSSDSASDSASESSSSGSDSYGSRTRSRERDERRRRPRGRSISSESSRDRDASPTGR
jgi:hypothetical protein